MAIEGKSTFGNRGKGRFRGGGCVGRGGQYEEYGRGRGNQGGRNGGKQSVASVQCQICGRLNHSAMTCYQRYNHATASVNVAEASFSANNSQNWLADSGAIHHVTNALNNLDIS